MTLSRRNPNRPLVVAHRGASGLFPENTVRAFRAAIASGADCLECDVRPTADGVPVIFHDAELRRLVGIAGRIEQRSLAGVRRLRIRIGPSARPMGESVPTLESLATLARRRHRAGSDVGRPRLVVEIKVQGDAPRFVGTVVRILRRTGHRDAAIISFSPRVVDRVYRTLRWPLAGLILGAGTSHAAVARALRRHEPLLVLQKSLVRDPVVAAAARRGKRLWTYAIDRPDEQRRMAARGLDGIITNFPDRCVRALRPQDSPEVTRRSGRGSGVEKRTSSRRRSARKPMRQPKRKQR